MSILLSRLLVQAQKLLGEGDANEAEALCCQVIHGAIAVKDVALANEAARLLKAIPNSHSLDRDNACRALYNLVVGMQSAADTEHSLVLCDLLYELLKDDLSLRKAALEMAAYIATEAGGDRLKYLRLLLSLQPAAQNGAPASQRLEVSRDDGPEPASAILASRGCVVVRGLFDLLRVQRVREAGEALFVERAIQAAPFRDVEPCKELVTGAALTFLCAMLTPFFGHEPQLRPEISYLRQVLPDMPESHVPFHQDFNAFSRLIVNVWVPLVACGRSAPGLELVAERVHEISATVPAANQYDDLEISQELVGERFGAELMFAPELVPGDAVILLATTIHRTHMTPEMVERRTSLELRFG